MSDARQERAAAYGLASALVLVALAWLVPTVTGWQVHPRADRDGGVPPLHGLWDPKVAPASVAALALAVVVTWRGAAWAAALRWRPLLAGSFAVGAAWMLALALVDGTAGISRVLGNPDEYLRTARSVTSVHALLSGYVDRIPLSAPDNWPIHVAGHPPGMLLFFVALVRLGLGGDLAAGVVVTLVAATLPAAVLTTLRALDREQLARRAAPYLVLTPAAVFLAVSADAVMAATAAWGVAALAVATRRGAGRGWPWAVGAGLLLGSACLMSYGLPLMGVLALAVLAAGRSWWPLPVAALAAIAVVALFALLGFSLLEAYPVLRDRYWAGVARERPAAYWVWGDLAALALSAGPMVGAGLALVARTGPRDRVLTLLVGAGTAMVVAADLSQMSKGEVERIWLPFVPWLTLGLVLLPERWRRPALAVQAVTALLLQHLLYTSW
ncbi:hypothetical protein [Nocardioides panacisoli]|uniref:Glycosyltransferase family 39 protein n=1 Tax=Nocardioides panacisoli TaxID=627624 RepID=A0ABP7IC28_9ACTN